MKKKMAWIIIFQFRAGHRGTQQYFWSDLRKSEPEIQNEHEHLCNIYILEISCA